MAETSDYSTVNDASAAANWTASGFDTPTLNDTAATTPIYIEGTACMWWPLKKGTTNGYTYEATPNQDISNGEILVAFLNYPFSDIDNIPITSMFIRLSSATGFTTNYAQWDAKAQILAPRNTPISGFTPVMVYPTNPDATSGTPNYADLESFGWVATTGNDADGKQGGFDWFFIISWIGGHSETYTDTFFSQLATHATPVALPGTAGKPFGCFSRAGDFYQSNINIKIGTGAGDTAVSVTETSKTIFFNNVEPEHNLGYIFENPATGTSTFFLTNCVHFWNEQDGTTPQIFTGVANVDIFKLAGCAFARGGAVPLPAHDTVSTTYVQACVFDDCGVIDIGDLTFTGNTVSNAAIAVLYAGNGTRRSSDNTYSGNTVALSFDTAQTITVDGDSFSGNTYDIENSGASVLADSYAGPGDGGWTASTTYSRRAQSFTGNGGILSKAVLDLRKVGTPTGTLTVKLYAHSGTFGTSSVPTGAALDTATEVINADSLTTSFAPYQFNFTGGYTMVNGTYYCLAIEGTLQTGGNDWQVSRDNSAPTHTGNGSRYAAAWGASAADAVFEVYSGSGAITADSYSETNQSGNNALAGSSIEYGQSITGDGGVLSNVRFYLRKVGTPAGNMTVKLYAHSGTFGTSSVPTGAALATSVAIPADDLTTSYALTQFQFTDQYPLAGLTNYVIALAYTGTATDYVFVGTDTTTPTHAGNFSSYNGTTWTANAAIDACFYVSTGGILIVQSTNGANPITYLNSAVIPGAVIIQNAVSVAVTDLTEGTPVIIIAAESVGAAAEGSILAQGAVDSTGSFPYSHNYEGDLDVTIRARNQGVPVAAISDDNGTYVDETAEANNSSEDDMTLLPATPVINQDGYYFGHTEQFGGVKLWITTAGVGGGTITWQYWNGTTWAALTGVTDGTSSFSTTGENKVTWTMPGNWATTTINSQGPFYYVRARFTAGSFTTSPQARQCVLDATRYLPFPLDADSTFTIGAAGLSVQAVWTEDIIAQF